MAVHEVDAQMWLVFTQLLIANIVWITRLLGENSSGLIICPEMLYRNCEMLMAEN